jgi:SAM-dependent methyltransferase
MSVDYDELAADYHWLLDDAMLSGDGFVDAHSELFERLPAGASILDCACGTGNVALALARRGFEVHGSDGSEEMIRQARLAARTQDPRVPFHVASWERLPEVFRRTFDVMICAGNSLSHGADENAMIIALRAMASLLKRDGLLLLDSRNWELLREKRPRVEVLDPRTRQGERCIPVYSWSIPEAWDQPHGVEIVLVFDHGDHADARRHTLRFVPFRFDDLRHRLAEAGLTIAATDYTVTRERYSVVARKA